MTKLEGGKIDGVGMIEFRYTTNDPYASGASAKVCFFAGSDTAGVLEINGLIVDPNVAEAVDALTRAVEALVVTRFGKPPAASADATPAPQAAIPPGLVV